MTVHFSLIYVSIWSDFTEYLQFSLLFNFMFNKNINMSHYGLIFRIYWSIFLACNPPPLFIGYYVAETLSISTFSYDQQQG